jgi:hypothetical protein
MLFSLSSFALSLLLVFRTNQAYARQARMLMYMRRLLLACLQKDFLLSGALEVYQLLALHYPAV